MSRLTVADLGAGAGAGVRATQEPTTAPVTPGGGRLATGAPVGLAGLLAVAVILRFWTRSDLWLDEALSVHIARLPLDSMFEALRRDGSPPLYYVLLHGWMEVFGTGDVAVRSLSGAAGVTALPMIWLLGRDIGGRRGAVSALVLLASSPFAIRYSTEARMYSLVVLLTLVGALCLRRSLLRPTGPARAALAVTSGLLLLTHYWALYLVAVVALWLVARAWRGPERRVTLSCLAAVAAGGLLFLPWLPTFAFQATSTGTPWGGPADFTAVVDTVVAFGGGANMHGWLLTTVLVTLAGLGLFGLPLDGRRIELDLSTRPAARPLAFVLLATLAMAISVNWIQGTAFAPRYAAVVLVPFLLLGALGMAVLDDARLRAAVTALVALVGLYGASFNVVRNRTQASEVAQALRASAGAGDVVAYCPDQLGPAVSRLAPVGLVQTTFPDGAGPALVDWVDYEARSRAGDPAAFAAELVARAGPGHDVWLVWMPGYRTLGEKCDTLNARLGTLRPGATTVVVRHPGRYPERADLWRFPPP
ncbi:MAG: glycosyltransferase family 39 protein [Acidimicrobiales bacterium]